MKTLRRHFCASNALALLAAWAMALLPTLSLALGPAGGPGQSWAEVCTPQGIKQVAAGDEGAPERAAMFASHGTCCTGAGLGLALPPARSALLLPAPSAVRAGRVCQPLELGGLVWRCAQPRGPPVAG